MFPPIVPPGGGYPPIPAVLIGGGPFMVCEGGGCACPAPGGHPPVYGGGYGAPTGPPPTMNPQYGGRGGAVEVEGAGRSKAQLIVGIDFV